MWKTDEEIERTVENELDRDPFVDARDIAVQAKEGLVTLAGLTKSFTDKYLAERIAKRVQGVRAIANEIEVIFPGGPERADTEIARDAIAQLKRELPYSHAKVQALVRNGWVVLEGQVEWNFQRRSAESAVRTILGVKHVTNSILVKPKVSPAGLKAKIQEAFKHSSEVDEAHIRLEADESNVTLTGRVGSWSEKVNAGATARKAAGVTQVHNLIEVDPSLGALAALGPA